MAALKVELTSEQKDILFSDFPDAGVSFKREIVERFSKNTRGSVRLATGRYYTPEEMAERAKKVFSVKLY